MRAPVDGMMPDRRAENHLYRLFSFPEPLQTIRSALYRGDVVHQRHRPKKHHLRYRVFSLLIDLDELETLGKTMRFFGHNRFSLFSVHDRDHGSLDGGSLKNWAIKELEKAGLGADTGRIEMLCYPRILGYVFNPLTVYFCYHRNGNLSAILYEVCNTFKERFTYIIRVNGNERPVRQSAEKQFYVSPFIPMECVYHFSITPPQERVSVRINETDEEGPLLYAAFSGKKCALSDRSLLKAFFCYPLMTVKIIAGIHLEAVRLLIKGVPLYKHKPAGTRADSTVATGPRTPR
nr:DUF1365 domain-containing protein [Martelella mediterranea]